MKSINLVALAVTFLSSAMAPTYSEAASASASSANWYYKSDEGSSSVWFGPLSWASSADIDWNVPTFSADGTSLPTAPVPFSESKFNTSSTFPAGRVFTGYNINGTGPKGSTVISTGAGSSNKGAVFYGANWNVTASGGGTYDVKADAVDPWNILPSDFSNFQGSTYSLYIPFSMTSGSSDITGSTITSGFGFDVTYTTASGSTSLLDVLVNGSNAVVTPAEIFGSSLKFFLQPEFGAVPVGSTLPGTEISASALQSLLNIDIGSDGVLNSPIHLGIVLNDIPIPTMFLQDGSVAQIGQSAIAFESAAVPEPGSLTLIGFGALSLAGTYLWRRRRIA